ncbi:discoidin domain-containing protein [Micromonospora sp. DT43]|uniref:discoidin domain-containing protein n=1 Tax=Micromonospora sp. DT43 TaxID=3393440 RepID=UPI003CEDCF2A
MPEPQNATTEGRFPGRWFRPWLVSLLLVGLLAVAAVTLGSRLPDDRTAGPSTPPGDGGIVLTAGPGFGPPLPPGSVPPGGATTPPAPGPSAMSTVPSAPAPPAPAPPAPGAPGRTATGGAAKPTGGSAPKTNAVVSGRANPSGRNLALGRPASASSSENSGWVASKAFDGDTATRWASEFSDPQWIMVDLGEVWSITTVNLNWEYAHATAYHVDVSVDGTAWKTIFTTTSGSWGPALIPAGKANGQFVRVVGTKRFNQYGYSLWEFGVS